MSSRSEYVHEGVEELTGDSRGTEEELAGFIVGFSFHTGYYCLIFRSV